MSMTILVLLVKIFASICLTSFFSILIADVITDNIIVKRILLVIGIIFLLLFFLVLIAMI